MQVNTQMVDAFFTGSEFREECAPLGGNQALFPCQQLGSPDIHRRLLSELVCPLQSGGQVAEGEAGGRGGLGSLGGLGVHSKGPVHTKCNQKQSAKLKPSG